MTLKEKTDSFITKSKCGKEDKKIKVNKDTMICPYELLHRLLIAVLVLTAAGRMDLKPN
jgi:hypothetical protein